MFACFMLPPCLFALFAVAVYADEAVEQQDNTVDVADSANPAVKAVAKILGGIFASVAAGCLMEAVNQCKSHWKNPGNAISCGKNFLKQNKGHCAVDK